MISEFSRQIFYGLVVELFAIIITTKFENTRDRVIVFLLGTAIAGYIGFSPVFIKTTLPPVPTNTMILVEPSATAQEKQSACNFTPPENLLGFEKHIENIDLSTPTFGPASGTLGTYGFAEYTHKTYQDMIVSAEFSNPPENITIEWIEGFRIRDNRLDYDTEPGYTYDFLLIPHLHYWTISTTNITMDYDLYDSGLFTNSPNKGEGVFNLISVIVVKDQGLFLLNNEVVSNFKVVGGAKSGDVSVFAQDFTNLENPQFELTYKNFCVWQIQ